MCAGIFLLDSPIEPNDNVESPGHTFILQITTTVIRRSQDTMFTARSLLPSGAMTAPPEEGVDDSVQCRACEAKRERVIPNPDPSLLPYILTIYTKSLDELQQTSFLIKEETTRSKKSLERFHLTERDFTDEERDTARRAIDYLSTGIPVTEYSDDKNTIMAKSSADALKWTFQTVSEAEAENLR